MKISVIIPVYNAAAFVEEAVGSALGQAEVGEVLLVEDGSSDGSLAKCEALAAGDERVRLLRHPGGENRGAAETRSLGVREAQCEYIAFLDADDYYLPGRFERDREVLENEPQADGVYDAVGTHFENEQMRQWWREQGRGELSTVRETVPAERLFEAILGGKVGSFHTNGIVVRRELFERTGLFDAELRMTQDFAMWIKMTAVGRLLPGSIDEPVAMRRLHGDNRIVQQSRDHRMYAFLMWRMLAQWAEDAGLPRDRRRRLAMGQLNGWRHLDDEQRRELAGTASTTMFLMRLARQYPLTLRTRRYWRELGRAMGGSRVRGVTRGLARSVQE